MGIGGAHSHLDGPVHLVGGIQSGRNPLKIGAPWSNNTFLAKAAHRGKIAAVLAALRHTNVEGLHGSVAVEYRILPVGSLTEGAGV